MNKEEIAKVRKDILNSMVEQYDKTKRLTKLDKMLESFHNQIHFWRIKPLSEQYPTISFFLGEDVSLDSSERSRQLQRVNEAYFKETNLIKKEISELLNEGYTAETIQIKFLKEAYIFYTNVFNQKIFPERLKEVEQQAIISIASIEKTIAFLNAFKYLITIEDNEFNQQIHDEQNQIYNDLENHYLYY